MNTRILAIVLILVCSTSIAQTQRKKPMLTTTAINDSRGVIIGHIEDTEDKQTLLNERGEPLAYFDKRSNKTFDKRGMYFGDGNQTMRMLPQK